MSVIDKKLVIVRGGGDIATGSIQKLYRVGFKVLILEIEKPTSIRRKVSFSEAIYDNETKIEGISAKFCRSFNELESCWNEKKYLY